MRSFKSAPEADEARQEVVFVRSCLTCDLLRMQDLVQVADDVPERMQDQDACTEVSACLRLSAESYGFAGSHQEACLLCRSNLLAPATQSRTRFLKLAGIANATKIIGSPDCREESVLRQDIIRVAKDAPESHQDSHNLRWHVMSSHFH